MLELPKRILARARRSSRSVLYGLHGRLHDTVTIQTKQGRLTFSTRDEESALRYSVSGSMNFTRLYDASVF